MHRRHQQLNIPIEIVRTVVAISETGSLSKAGERLGLSQPAVSSQIKRIQSLVGGSLFMKTANGSTTTELGKLVVHQARRILEANDQLLRLGGTAESLQPVRVGLSSPLFHEFIRRQNATTLADVFIHADRSAVIARGLLDGHIDIACIFENPEVGAEIAHLIVNESSEKWTWARSKNFVLSPGAPIPVLTWPGDDWMLRTLTRQGLSFKIVFRSPDYQTKIAAAEAGIGLMAVPLNMIPPTLVKAEEYYLPPLVDVKAYLYSKSELTDSTAPILKQLSALFFKGS